MIHTAHQLLILNYYIINVRFADGNSVGKVMSHNIMSCKIKHTIIMLRKFFSQLGYWREVHFYITYVNKFKLFLQKWWNLSMQHIAWIRHLNVEFLHYGARNTQLHTHLNTQNWAQAFRRIELDTHTQLDTHERCNCYRREIGPLQKLLTTKHIINKINCVERNKKVFSNNNCCRKD
jgi:hypothetical protein